MSDEEEEEEEVEEEEEEDEKEEKEQPPPNDEFNQFRQYNAHSNYANMHKTNGTHNPLAYYYERQLPIPFQPSSFWADRVQYHQQEIDRAKLILNKMQQHTNFPYHNSFDYERPPNNTQTPYNHKPTYDQSTRYQTLSYSKTPPQSFNNQPYSQQSSFIGVPPNYQTMPPSIPQPYPPYFQAYPPPQAYPEYIPPQIEQPPPPYYQYSQNYHQQQLQQQQMMQQKQSQRLEDQPQKIEITSNNKSLPTGVSQYQPETPQPVTQDYTKRLPDLDENEREYIEFLKYKEHMKKQQQLIDDQDFQDFLEFRRLKQQQIFKSTVQIDEEKRSLTDLYKRKNRQVFSEDEFRPQIARRNELEQLQKVAPYQEPNTEIDKAISVLLKSQRGNNTKYK